MTWLIDSAHTHIGFSVKHLMVSTVRGQFKKYSGTIEVDPSDFSRSKIEGVIDVTSIDTGNTQRDDHLRTGDFFDAPAYPVIAFKSTRIEPKSDGEYVVHGDLTIRGVTKPVAFDVEFNGISKNPFGKTIAGIGARATINRKDFGVSFNMALEGGGLALGDKVKIEIDAELVAPEATVKPAAAAPAPTGESRPEA
jgi:polyisoprenoid-binding protein YceI